MYDTNSGQELYKLLPPGPGVVPAFGRAVAIGGGFALVGVDSQDPLGPSVHVYDSTTGQLIRSLRPTVPSSPLEQFGTSLALVGTTAIVGAISIVPHGGPFVNGSVYLFDVLTGQQINQLLPASQEVHPFLGLTLAAGDDRVVVSAGGTISPSVGSGNFHVFQLSTGQHMTNLTPSEASLTFTGGIGVAYDSAQYVVGDPLSNVNGFASGGAYVFDDIVPNNGVAYCSGDGTGAACPCQVNGEPGQGCAFSCGTTLGGRMDAVGNAQLGNSSLILRATSVAPNSVGLFFQGSNQQSLPLGEGILCTGVGMRFGVQQTGNHGIALLSGVDAAATPGATINYQFWFRDAQSTCGLGGDNFTNAWSVTW